MTTVLVTGFGAFGTTLINPAKLVAQALDGANIGNANIVSKVAPCNFFKCIDVVKAAITKVQPDIVIMMGEYGGRSLITVERLAQNLNDSARYQLADDDGLVLQDKLTVPGGPVAYYTTAASQPISPIPPVRISATIYSMVFCITLP
jgi:pyroglutamyl-peptidase